MENERRSYETWKNYRHNARTRENRQRKMKNLQGLSEDYEKSLKKQQNKRKIQKRKETYKFFIILISEITARPIFEGVARNLHCLHRCNRIADEKTQVNGQHK